MEQPQMQAPAPAPAPQPGQPGAPDKAKARQVLKQIVMAGMKIIYDPTTSKNLVQMMGAQKDDPAAAVAHAAMTVIGQLKEKITGLNSRVVYTAAPAIMVFLFDLARAAKLFPSTPQELGKATQILSEMVKQQGAQPAAQPAPPAGLVGGAMAAQPAPVEA